MSGTAAAAADSGSTSLSMKERRQLVGFNDDILDLKFIPSLPTNEELFDSFKLIGSSTSSSSPSSSSSSSSSVSSTYALGVVTNSAQVRLIDNDFNCLSLNGHADIVLCIDVTPDG